MMTILHYRKYTMYGESSPRQKYPAGVSRIVTESSQVFQRATTRVALLTFCLLLFPGDRGKYNNFLSRLKRCLQTVRTGDHDIVDKNLDMRTN